MQTKLRSYIPKENDINDYQRKHDKNISQTLQPHHQNINYSETKFFSNCQKFLTDVASDAKQEQKILQHKKKMKALDQPKQQQQKIDEILLINIIVDYFRSHQMNYCYSMIMRQKNMISEDVVLKGQLAQLLGLKDQLQNDSRFNVSVLELIIQKFHFLEQLINKKKQHFSDFSVQCELLMNNHQTNNILLTEIKLQQIRKQTQLRERKHYQTQIHLFKQQQLLKLREDMNKVFENKQTKIAEKYEEKLREIIRSNTQSTQSNSKLKQLDQYLKEIQQLTKENRTLKQHTTKLEKQSLEHNCLKHESIIQKLQQIHEQRKQMQRKKQQFQLALKNINTNVEDMAMKKNKLLNDDKRQTEQYLNKIKTHKQNKDYMIQKVYSTLRGFQQRIQNLSKDNANIYQENQLLRNQLNGMKKILGKSQTKIHEDEKRTRLNLTQIKIATKNFSFNVTPQQIYSQTQGIQPSKVQTEDSFLTYNSEEYEDKMREKAEQAQRINRLKYEMGLLKSKVKHMVMDFDN